MGSARPVSIVIVSRNRPDALRLCLTGVAQLDHPAYEVIVVACPAGLAAVAAHPQGQHVKTVAFDRPNISEARNLGVALAAGEVVAFIDDDSVPEPLWLRHLTAPFDDPEVAASGGYVIGRNGISYQWTARSVDARAETAPIPMPDDTPLVLHPAPGRAVKTEGTNMALRREVLAQMGGFDPAFRFYLEETDLNMRLARAGQATAIVPLAQVHHGFAASARRGADRVPRDLTQIGASLALYLRKHCPEDLHDSVWTRFRAAQRDRLLRIMQSGPLGPDDVGRLMKGLDAGWREGRARDLPALPALPRAAAGFAPFPGRPDAPRRSLSGRPWQRRALHAAAAEAVRKGQIATLVRLSPTALYHRVRMHPDGYWEHIGGIWGRAQRDNALIRMTTFRRRVAEEIARVTPVRGE
ncbi:glycosyltransferase family 2 protein [Aestuariicoccus sp. MJ-SS9]|uniref:glycosyltransferase family 2 protein n=1 Tax=Aestuariicoccus sp. MJ-SS9 TaxID=3079855 RepID=UPI002909E292|nr:glycosyltransferase [Aestuariicoccus sp. MJ-SS9]MDU8910193.1 glycosyltransferase [Aestuariicoccus sp. MJ-SS9]